MARRKRFYNLKDDYDLLPKKVRDCVKQLSLLPGDAKWFDIKPDNPEIMCARLIAADALLLTGSNIENPSIRWPDGTSKLKALQSILQGKGL